jgi:hypothetical protein
MDTNASGTFGRRQPRAPQNELPPSDDDGPITIGRDTIDLGGGGEKFKTLRGILFAVGVLFALAAGYVGVMKGLGRSLDRFWFAELPSVEDAYRRSTGSDALLEQVHNNCKSRSDFVGQLDRRRLDPAEIFQALNGEVGLSKAAMYVSCLATEQPERFCKPAHRAHLVAAVKEYFSVLGRVRAQRAFMSNGPFAAVQTELMAAGGRDTRRNTPLPSAQTDERLVGGLRRAIMDGYLSQRDFSSVFGLPGDLETRLRGVEPRRDGCA